jgi:hypothetical protein
MAAAGTKKRPLNFLRFQTIPTSILFITIGASWLGMTACIVLGYPLAVTGIVTVLPWLPVLFTESLWKYKHYKWFALYGILIITQGLHFIEHIAQIVEVDVVGLPRSQSRGIIGNLDAEYVHFFFDTFLLIGVIILLFRFRKNIALWVTFVVGVWHTAEHWYITYFYTFDRANFNPAPAPGLHAHEGLLAKGGLLWPNSPLPRIELHFIYNLLFTIPLVWGFIVVMRDAYDEYLKKAFPRLNERQLAGLNNSIEGVQVQAGDLIIRQGEPADKFYIISKGEVEIIQQAGGAPIVINRLSQGQFFGEVGLLTGAQRNASVRAVTTCELLALDRDTFRAVIGSSAPTAQDFGQILAQRASSPGIAAVPVGAALAVGAAGSGPPPPLPQASGPSYPQASGPSYPQASGPSYPQGSGPSGPQASNPTIAAWTPPPAPPQMVMSPPAAPPSGPTARAAPDNLDTPTLAAFADPGATQPPQRAPAAPAVEPDAMRTVVSRTPPVFRDTANSWSYGLIFTSGQLQGQGVVLSAARMQIGRDVGNEIRISDDAQVSRHHAELLRTPSGEFQIHDLRSSNGVFVNGERLAADETRMLHENDQVTIGNAAFALRKVGTRVV